MKVGVGADKPIKIVFVWFANKFKLLRKLEKI
jgi:hypothetical protein